MDNSKCAPYWDALFDENEQPQITPDRLRELVEADRDGRCVVFKFGLGSTVYRPWVTPDGIHSLVTEEKMDTVQDLVDAELWRDAYKTSEAAEAALKAN